MTDHTAAVDEIIALTALNVREEGEITATEYAVRFKETTGVEIDVGTAQSWLQKGAKARTIGARKALAESKHQWVYRIEPLSLRNQE